MLKKSCQWWALLGLAWGLSLSRPSVAADVQVRVACVAWSPERASRVEARIRATLLLEDWGAKQVLIACRGGNAVIDVESDWGGSLSSGVTLDSASLEDAIVHAVELSLRELRKLRDPQPEEEEEPATPRPVPFLAEAEPLAPDVVAAPAPAAAPSASSEPPAGVVPTPAWLEASLSALGERWASHNALGAGVGASLGNERVRYGIELGGLAALGEPAGFDVNEWHVGARLSWAPSWFFGVRGHLGLGGSLFLTTPQGLSVDTATSLSAGFAEVGVARPFWFGAIGLAPELGLRVSSAERRVRVNEDERLVLPVLVPAARLSLVWRQR